MLNSGGIRRSSSSGIGFCAPSLASLSLSSFPWSPLCPLTHLKCVVAVWCLRRKAAFLKSGAFWTAIHLMSSQFVRCKVRPSITYFESECISKGMKVGRSCAALITATSSPTWFDCSFPGTRIVWFLGSSGAIHMPLLHCAFDFPLLKHAPSV